MGSSDAHESMSATEQTATQRYPKTCNGIRGDTPISNSLASDLPPASNIVALLTFRGTNQGLFGWGQGDDRV